MAFPGLPGCSLRPALAVVVWIAGDPVVFLAACVLAASVAGFLLVNFPQGRIFLGDGGAYLVRLLLALLSVIPRRGAFRPDTSGTCRSRCMTGFDPAACSPMTSRSRA